MAEVKGVWRTVRGRRVFIKEGEDLKTAMINSGKFKEMRKSYFETDEKLYNKKRENETAINKIDREIDKKDFYGGSLDEDYDKLTNERHRLMAENADLQKQRELNERKYYENSKHNREGLNITKEQFENLKRNSDVNRLAEKTMKENAELAKYHYGQTAEQTQQTLDKWKARKEAGHFDPKNYEQHKAFVERQIDAWEKNYKENVEGYDNRLKEMNDRDIVYKEKSKEDINYEATKKDILKHYTEDYGWTGTTPEEAFVKQMDAVNYGNATPYQMGKRLAEGGNYEVYNGNMQAYLKQRGMEVEYDDAFSTYTDYIGKQSERLYNEIKSKKVEQPTASTVSKENIQAKVKRFNEQKGKELNNNRSFKEEIPQAVIKKLNQKGLKELANNGATDITRYSEAQIKALEKKHGRLEKVKVSMGTYGMNGGLFRSNKTGEYFVITSRNGNLFYMA